MTTALSVPPADSGSGAPGRRRSNSETYCNPLCDRILWDPAISCLDRSCDRRGRDSSLRDYKSSSSAGDRSGDARKRVKRKTAPLSEERSASNVVTGFVCPWEAPWLSPNHGIPDTLDAVNAPHQEIRVGGYARDLSSPCGWRWPGPHLPVPRNPLEFRNTAPFSR